MIKIYVCSNSKLEGVEGCVAQTIIEDEGVKRAVKGVSVVVQIAL